jgi:bifunctional DNase/RNase
MYFSSMLIAVEVASFAVQADNAPLVILKETGGDRTIAIPLGSYEASAIAIKSLNVISEKPLTIDLVKSIVETFQGKIEKVIINGPLSDPSAHLYVIFGNQTRVIECRPGDGISLAMRTEARLFADEKVFGNSPGILALSEAEQLKSGISNIDTLDFGKYYIQ